MKYEKWDISEPSPEATEVLCRGGIPPLVAHILSARGTDGLDDAISLLNGEPNPFHDPFLMSGMEEAVIRIKQAIERNEHVAIYGDYDADGITASCLLGSYLCSRGLERCNIYIPDRVDEGYGLNQPAIKNLARTGVTLIVTVDCGVTAVDEAEFAKALGVDLIITDHHECMDALPAAAAVINPRRPDCAYPYKSLSGVGVAFKLVCAMEKDRPPEDLLEVYGDLVALGTIADVMPVTGENRSLIRHGMDTIRNGTRPGLHKLINECGIKPEKLKCSNISYLIAPRINAAGRMGRVSCAVALLLENDPYKATSLAEELCRMNIERRQLEKEIHDNALELLESQPPGLPIVLASEGWSPGVVGIVAARLAEQYRVPAVMVCLSEGKGKGSCRSFGGFNIFDALSHCSDVLDGFGGHALAAGMSIDAPRLGEFRQRLWDYYQSGRASEFPAQNTLNIDLSLNDPGLLTMPNVESLSTMEPYGAGNLQPLLCIENAELAGIYAIGGGAHTRLRIRKARETFDCVFFSVGESELGLNPGNRVDIAFSPQINEYKGKKSVQLVLQDVRGQ